MRSVAIESVIGFETVNMLLVTGWKRWKPIPPLSNAIELKQLEFLGHGSRNFCDKLI